MNVMEAIKTKRAVRQFAPDPVPEETIRAIVNAGRRAQSSKNTQPWSFVIVQDPERLKALAAAGPFAGHLGGAAFGVMLLSPDPAQRWSIPFDLGQAAAYMQLTAWELGVGSCLGAVYEQEQVRQLLGIPAEWHCYAFLSFGYPAPAEPRPARKDARRPLRDVARWEHW